MSDTITHIAGATITVEGRVIQRCSLCGAKLCDSEGCMMLLEPGKIASEFPTWETGRLVQVTAGNPTQSILLPEADRLPLDSCIVFV